LLHKKEDTIGFCSLLQIVLQGAPHEGKERCNQFLQQLVVDGAPIGFAA
jgi:hypothetical protein